MGIYIDNDDNDDNVDKEEIITRIIYRAMPIGVSKTFFKIANMEPLSQKNCSVYNTACSRFQIIEGDTVYLIYDSTSFGTLKKGLVIAQSGVYVSGKRLIHYSWQDFLNVNLGERFANLYIGNDTIGGTPNVRELCVALIELQENMRRIFE